MDLDQLRTTKADTGATLKLRSPFDYSILEGMTITVLGADSDKWIKLRKKREQANMDFMVRTRAKSLNAEMQSKAIVEDLAEITVGWTGGIDPESKQPVPYMTLGGEKLECTPENCRLVYGNPKYGWIKDQVDEFINDRNNFL